MFKSLKWLRVATTILLVFLTIGSISSEKTNAAADPRVKVEPPKLPPVWEIYKTMNKEEFQPSLNIEQAPGLAVAPNISENTERSLKGFRGYYFTDSVNGTNAVILNNSVNISTEGNWKVEGLVRNEKTSNVGTITVKVDLRSATGAVLESISSQSLVKNLRPGEPSPFIINSSTPASQVKDVTWTVSTDNVDSDFSRDANIMTDYELQYGSDTYKGFKRDDPPYPYVLATAFDNLGRALKTANVVVAWTDKSGKVIHIETSPLDVGFKDGVKAGGAASFKNILVSDDTIGPKLSQNPYTLWVMGK